MPVNYLPQALVITLLSTDPVCLHADLIRSIITSLRFQNCSPEPVTDPVKESNCTLLQILAAISPGETELQQIRDKAHVETS